MPEIRNEVKVFRTKYICDKCLEGEMVFDGRSTLSIPPSHHHTCTKCDNKKYIDRVKYPDIVYEDICDCPGDVCLT